MRASRQPLWLLGLLFAAFCSRDPATIEVSPKHSRIYGISRTQRLAARILDRKGRLVEAATPNFSSSQSAVVEVDSSGRLTGIAEGNATVRVTYKKLETSVPVEVIDVKSIELDPPAARLVGPAGSQFPLHAVAKNSKDQPVSIPLSWLTLDPAVATVSPDGVVTSVGRGATSAVVRVGDLQSASQVTVEIREIAKIEIRPATALVRVGDSQRFEVVAYDENGRPIEGASAVFRSSNPSVAALDGNGKASGISPGTALIRATLAGVSAEATLIVN